MKTLIVSQPQTPGTNPLPGVTHEVVKVKSHLDTDQIIHLDGERATVKAVLSALTNDDCKFIHFACHGIQDLTKPIESAFMLHDGKLTLSHLMTSSAGNAELAFLSACQTSAGDMTLPDEAVHLAAGMLAAGCKSVIGTMWSINDDDAPVVADEVYRRLKEGFVPGEGKLRSAYALHEAMRVLRERVGEQNFIRWVPYVHFGL